jgi:elongation factor G
MAFQDACEKSRILLLEPQMRVEVQVPDEFVGEIINDLTVRRADITEVETHGKMKVVKAHVALARMFGYATTARSLSQGRAHPSMELYKYSEVGPEVYERFNF